MPRHGTGSPRIYTARDQEEALRDAEEAWPDSDFAASCRDQWEDTGSLSDLQVETLHKIATKAHAHGFGDLR